MEEKMNTRRRRDMEEEEEEVTQYLPHDFIITQILPRLPVKSLLRFKCVCKSWFYLISDPQFAKSHFQITAAKHTPRILFMSDHFQKTLSLDSESKLDFHSALKIPNPNFVHFKRTNFVHPQAHFYVDNITSCRGFIFLFHSSNFKLWNPSTGAIKEIPLSPNNKLNLYNGCYLYGFGYDLSRDDYLIVLVSYKRILLADVNLRLEFFSLRDNMWKEIEGTRFPYICDTWRGVTRVGLFFNGGIHWLAQNVDREEYVILTFDAMERKFLEMPYPDGYNYTLDNRRYGLWVYGEFLSLWVMDFDNQRVEIWAMKEYKVDSSWTKAFFLPTNVISPRSFSLLYSTKSGDVVGTNGNIELLKYNDKGQFIEYEPYRGDPHEPQITVFTESLLSLPGDNVQA